MRLNSKKVFLIMARKCMSKKDLARALGVSGATCSRYFTHSLTAKTLGRIAKALNVDAEELI